MRKNAGMNKHQKAVRKAGERHTSSAEIAELLQLSCSANADERLIAAEHLCPCHVRRRLDPVWEALFRMMEDSDRRVRQAAWHTLEDGGRPNEPQALQTLERVLRQEKDPKVRRFAEGIMAPVLQQQRRQEYALLNLPGRAQSPKRGKCDFCGEAGIPVDFDPETPIPTADGTRSALICARCAGSA